MDDSTKNLISVIISAAQLAIVVAGAMWAYFRFVRERAHSPRMALGIECEFYGPQSASYLAALCIIIRNEGLVQQRLQDIRLRLLGIASDQPFGEWDADPPRVEFPVKLVDAQVIYKKKYGHIFVEPGVEQRLTYVTQVPQGIAIVLARVEFQYEGRRRQRTHSAERVFRVAEGAAA
jgi:hypothetical protein